MQTSKLLPALTIVLGTLAALACSAGNAQTNTLDDAQDKPVPGRYEVTTVTTYTDVPLPDTTVTIENCLTREDLDKDPASIFAALPEGKSCEVGEFQMSGGKISMRLSCSASDGNMVMITGGTYDKEGYDMVSDVTVTVGEQQVEMRSTIHGRRLGDC